MVWRRLGFVEKATWSRCVHKKATPAIGTAIAAWADEIGQFFQSDLSAAEQYRGM